MGCSCSKSLTAPSSITILVIGLDNSGKTTLSRTINGEVDPLIVPTVGFSAPIKKQYNNYDITFYDLGGGARIRGVWPQYFADVHGIIYVVDSSDKVRLQENQTELHNALQHPMIVGKPVLILANKADIEHALSSEAVADALELEKLTLCRHTLIPCTAKAMKTVLDDTNVKNTDTDNTGTTKNHSTNDTVTKNAILDPRISLGLEWLIQAIITDWPALEERRKKEQIEHKRIEDEKRKERLRRIAEEQAEKEKDKKQSSQIEASASAASSSSSSDTSTVTKDKFSAPAVPLCKVCQKDPAVRRCAAAGWEAVCDPCGTRLEEEKERKRKITEHVTETVTETTANTTTTVTIETAQPVSPVKETTTTATASPTVSIASPGPSTNPSETKSTSPLVAALDQIIASPVSSSTETTDTNSNSIDVSATPQKSIHPDKHTTSPVSAHTPAASQIHQHDTTAVSPSITLLQIPTSPIGHDNNTMEPSVVQSSITPATTTKNETEAVTDAKKEESLAGTAILSPPKALVQEFEEVATPNKAIESSHDDTTTNTTVITNALGTTDMNITHIPLSPS